MDDEEELHDVEQEAEWVAKPPKVLSFGKRIKKLSPNWLPLKKWMKDQTINYIDVLCLDPLPTRLEEDLVPQVSWRLALQKLKLKDERAT